MEDEILALTLGGLKALTFDTGGTILDWHTGFSTAFAIAEASMALTKTGRNWPTSSDAARWDYRSIWERTLRPSTTTIIPIVWH